MSVELKAYQKTYRQTRKYRICAPIVSSILRMPPIRIDHFTNLKKPESRWEFTALVFGTSLFLFSLFPAFWAFSLSPNGGAVMSPFAILAWVFLGLGIGGLIFVGMLMIYFKGTPTIEEDEHALTQIKSSIDALTEEIRKWKPE